MLTDAKIAAAQATGKAYKLHDMHRLHLLVSPRGNKRWQMLYKFGEKHKTLSFGSYPLISIEEAREKRDNARRQLLDGRDPAALRRLVIHANIEAAANTFEKIAREWHEINKPNWARIHAWDVLRSLERDVFPSIGKIPIADLNPPTILKTLRGIETRDAIETARRVRQRISAVFVYALACGIVDSDPAEKLAPALKPLPRRGKQPAITDIIKLRQMLNDVDNDPARPVTRLALRLLGLTAVRPGELRGARWKEFTLEGPHPIWRIPAERMKGSFDRKTDEDGDHLVPLVPESIAVIRVVAKLTGRSPFLFPSQRHTHRPMSENALSYLLNRAGYHQRHVPHGFRAAFSTIMNEWAKSNGRKDDREIIDLMLAHVPFNKVEAAYNRAAYMPRRRELAQIWATMLCESLTPPERLLKLKSKPSTHKGIPKAIWGPSRKLAVPTDASTAQSKVRMRLKLLPSLVVERA